MQLLFLPWYNTTIVCMNYKTIEKLQITQEGSIYIQKGVGYIMNQIIASQHGMVPDLFGKQWYMWLQRGACYMYSSTLHTRLN